MIIETIKKLLKNKSILKKWSGKQEIKKYVFKFSLCSFLFLYVFVFISFFFIFFSFKRKIRERWCFLVAMESRQMGGTLVPPLASALLDSNLISETFYNLKVVQCGSYYQLYFLENIKKTPIGKNDNFDDLNLKSYNEKNVSSGILNEIRFDNIIRSKLLCQRLAKCNSDDWKTFITLTFKENILDIKIANYEFKKFVSKVRRVFKDLKYIAIPEFQKRGAVHYHVLTNIDFLNKKLIYEQENNKKFLHVNYWNNGFTNVEIVSKDIKKIVGYISKYMTKTIDNRLFGHRRFFYSLNLKKPGVSYLNLNNIRDKKILENLLSNKSIIYSNVYLNKYCNEKISFMECL